MVDIKLILPIRTNDEVEPYINEIITAMIVDFVYDDEEYVYHVINDIGECMDDVGINNNVAEVKINHICEYIRSSRDHMDVLLHNEKVILKELLLMYVDILDSETMLLHFIEHVEDER